MAAKIPNNPLIPGFAPDPSIVFVDDTYYLVNSTFHVFPGLPIYASHDLIHWKQICNAINRREQLSLKHSDTKLFPQPNGEVMLATGGLYAPTIRYHDGTFYVVCTNILHLRGQTEDKSENFIVSTRDIWKGEWSDPVYFEFKGIDPSLLFDEDGKVYICGSAGPGPMTTINLFEVDLPTGKKLSEEKKIWNGTGGIYPEGPHIYKVDFHYYLVISEGGTHGGHMITIARSTEIWGPYEAFEGNPILTASGTNEYIQYTGHCDAFQDKEGKWRGVCLGVRKDQEGRFIMGRETFLTSANWDAGNWLKLDLVKENLKGIAAPKTIEEKLTAVSGVDILYIRDHDPKKYKFSEDYSAVVLTTSSIDLFAPEDSPSFVGKRQRRLEGKSSVTINHVTELSKTPGLKAGIAVYKDEHRYLRVFYSSSGFAIISELYNNAKKISRSSERSIPLPETIEFTLEYTEKEYKVFYTASSAGASTNGQICLATVDTLELTDPDFVGPVIGVYTTTDNGEEEEVSFSKLIIQ
jgi:beta-xylosidase